MKMMEPYSPTPRAKAMAAPVSIAGISMGITTRVMVCTPCRAQGRGGLLDFMADLAQHRLHGAHA